MNRLVRAELRKLRATRSWWLLAAAPVLYPLVSVAAAAVAGETADIAVEPVVRSVADVAALTLLIGGVLATAGEHRHGTIVPSLLVAPGRIRFVTARLAAQALIALGVASVAIAVALVASAAYAAGSGVAVDAPAAALLGTCGGVLVVAVFYAAAGTALGAVVRNQTAAITSALLWHFVVENVIPIVLRNPELRHWLPSGATTRLLHLTDPAPEMVGAPAAVLLLAVVLAALAAAALTVTARADVG